MYILNQVLYCKQATLYSTCADVLYSPNKRIHLEGLAPRDHYAYGNVTKNIHLIVTWSVVNVEEDLIRNGR